MKCSIGKVTVKKTIDKNPPEETPIVASITREKKFTQNPRTRWFKSKDPAIDYRKKNPDLFMFTEDISSKGG